jgi:hypothetical protein
MTNSDQQYSTMGKEKKGQKRQTVISNTAQWAKEKQAFLWPLCCIADHCLSFCPLFPLVIVLYC